MQGRAHVCLRLSSVEIKQAVQLVTLIVGKRSRNNKWCHVKTTSNQSTKKDVFRFYANDENLRISVEDSWCIRYMKATVQCFKAKRVHVPGFEIVIVSTVPERSGLGSSSALVVALYTFLEAITKMQTANILEKTLACHLAKKLASGSRNHCVVDSLISIVGEEDKIISFDSRSLTVDEYDWETFDTEMILITRPTFAIEKSLKYRSDATRQTEITIIRNTTSRWRTDPEGSSMMERLFPEETMTLTANIDNGDKIISEMTETIKTRRWKKLGRMLKQLGNVAQPGFVIFFVFVHCIVLMLHNSYKHVIYIAS
ncbi:PREDICTED: galactokinase-like [Dufourea novaeangliae]|uniref:Galactokinase n=1 Tax=Dufourea novaeangliae TaxID=178035 RepID=A0A154P7K3_DUFNO|nr:PREDICTED: galactokinase-like [Dufourea novaeangliae]KZC07925.1 Galactokinase [Dufourea novaeangliae]